MITKETYQAYLQHLLRGEAGRCESIVDQLLDQRIAMLDLYSDLFRQSLYDVGDLWERNRISVAVEHLATAITERILATAYPRLVASHEPSARRAVISCTVNEYHQVGARMVADVMEDAGWDVRFLGASTPEQDLLQILEEDHPQLLGLSVSIYFNMARFVHLVEAVKHHFPDLEILAGGQAFRWGRAGAPGGGYRVAQLSDLRDLTAELGR